MHSTGNQPVILNNIKHIFIKMKNSIKAMYALGDINLSLIDQETNVKVNNDLKLSFQNHFNPAINKITQQCDNN